MDTVRDKGYEQAPRFNVVLKKSRALIGSPALQNILLKLVGNNDEVEVTREIQKALKQAPVG